jgi:diamine N-acetyltransferase
MIAPGLVALNVTETVSCMRVAARSALLFHENLPEVFETNPRTNRTYEKTGFVYEGCKRLEMFKDGRYFDVLTVSVLREEGTGANEK